jgi:hypothetical protein
MTRLAWAGVFGLFLLNYYLRIRPGRFGDLDFTSLQSIGRELFPFVLALCLGGGFTIALIAVPYLIGCHHGRSGATPRADSAITAFVVFCTLGLWTLYNIFWSWLISDYDRVDFIKHVPFLHLYLPTGSLVLVYLFGRYQGSRETSSPSLPTSTVPR